jgi:peptidoglycan/xylan/chitin deacetylase (PgdA/CDA1 family)
MTATGRSAEATAASEWTHYVGVAWDAAGYRIEVVDRSGSAATSPRSFEPTRTDEMIAYMLSLGEQPVAVVESTNGILDGRMMAAGLTVYRADPELLPKRPKFGSVPAGILARAAHRDLPALTRLERRRGTQTGREAWLDAIIASSATATDHLTKIGRCLSNGRRDRPEVALTFDDGPLAPYTGQILDVLDRYRVPATFFCVGMNVGADAEDLSRMLTSGHAIANHTWSHPFLPELSKPQLVEQIDRTQQAVAKVTGGVVPKLFRPPYGSRTPQVLTWLAEVAPTAVLWDVAPDDWTMPGTDVIADTVLEHVQNGSIVLLHDGGGDRSQTVAALPMIIEGLLARDFSLVLVDDLKTAFDRQPASAPRVTDPSG